MTCTPNTQEQFNTEPSPEEKANAFFEEGVITRLVTQKKDPNRVSIYINGEFIFGLPREVVIQHGLSKGDTLDQETQRKLVVADQLVRAKALTLEYISTQARTEYEVRKKLKLKEFSELIIESVIERFRELRYLDDEAYARAFAKSRLTNRGYGPKRILIDLQKKGIPPQYAQDAIALLDDLEDPLEAVRALAKKRWTQLQSEPNTHKRRKKLSDFLSRKGFDFGTVRQLLDETSLTHEDEHQLDPNAEPEHPTPTELPTNPLEDARPLAQKRWRRLSSEKDPRKRQKKLQDYLQRQGFRYDITRQLLAELLEADALEEAETEEAETEEEEIEETEIEVTEIEEDDPLTEAVQAARKRYRRLLSEKNAKKRNKKLHDYLLRQGFGYGIARQVLDQVDAGYFDDIE